MKTIEQVDRKNLGEPDGSLSLARSDLPCQTHVEK